MPIDIRRVSIRDQDRLVASVPDPSLLYAADGTGGASSSLPNLVVSIPTVATNEVVEISLPTVASLYPVVSLPTVAAETLLVASLPTVATNEVAEISLPLVASLLPAVSLPTVATEISAVSLPTVATDPNRQSTTIATTSGSAENSSNEGPRALTVSDSLIDNCEAETRIDHQVDDDHKRASPNSIRTIDSPDSSSSSDGGSSESSQSNDKSRSPSDDRLGKFKKPTSQRADNNRDTSSRHGNNGERQQSRNYRNDDGQQRNSSSNQNQIIQTTVTRIKIETSLVIILITTVDNTIIIVCLTLTLISKTARDITPAETKIMRDSTLIPHTVSKKMTGI